MGKAMKFLYNNSRYEAYEFELIWTLRELIDKISIKYSKNVAFRYKKGGKLIEITYEKFVNDIKCLSNYLLQKDYAGKHIAVYGENSYEWIVTYFAVVNLGAVIIPMDKELSAEQLSELVEFSNCELLFYSVVYEDIIQKLQLMNPNLDLFKLKDLEELICKGINFITEYGDETKKVIITKDSLSTICFTSGTTGKPKGVMLTHGNLCFDLVSSLQNLLLPINTMLLLPLHHTFGFMVGILGQIYMGYSIYICNSMKNILRDMQFSKPGNIATVPIMVETIYNEIWKKAKEKKVEKKLKALICLSNCLLLFKIDLRNIFFKSIKDNFGGNLKLIICGGAVLDPEIVRGYEEFGIPIKNGYGITECSPIISSMRTKHYNPQSVGQVQPGIHVKFVDDEIWVKGENVSHGYYNDKKLTQEVFENGWFKTGDLGRIDEDGFLYIIGRKKNLIILSNGENVAAEELENLLLKIPEIKETVVKGVSNKIVAEVYLDQEISEEVKKKVQKDLKEINKKLPIYKNIQEIVFRDTEFPKNSSLKIKRY